MSCVPQATEALHEAGEQNGGYVRAFTMGGSHMK
jgi:hypothetical protein